MKKLAICAVLTLGVAVSSLPYAVAAEGGPRKEQGGGGQGENGERMLKAMSEHLQLTAEQQEKIKPIIADMVAQIRAAKKEGSQEKAAAARNAGYDKIAEQLTPEQKAKFDKMRERKEGGPKKEGGRKPK